MRTFPHRQRRFSWTEADWLRVFKIPGNENPLDLFFSWPFSVPRMSEVLVRGDEVVTKRKRHSFAEDQETEEVTEEEEKVA